MSGEMCLCIWDVEHGACATLVHRGLGGFGRLAMIDSGHAYDFRPSEFIRQRMCRDQLDYLFITNADQDHMSDLDGLWEADISVNTLYRNPHPPARDLRRIKTGRGGRLTNDIERYLSIHETFTGPDTEPFDEHMGGIQARPYFNTYPRFTDTNNLSCAVFFEYQGFKILFPGDLEEEGWLALLEQPAFRIELADLDILVASHHGRENGYCAELFDYCQPRAVIMSDKAIVHDTQTMAQTYYREVARNHPDGVVVATTARRRHVLTTRRDGHIEITVRKNGDFSIETEYGG